MGVEALNKMIDMRPKRKMSSRLFTETDAILRSSSEKKAIDNSFNEPSVSAAIGWNRRASGCTKRSYLAAFRVAACLPEQAATLTYTVVYLTTEHIKQNHAVI